MVGEELAAHCEPVRLAGKVLVVRAESPAWATQLRYLTAQLIERAEIALGPGSVREVRVTVGRLEGEGSAAPTRAAPAEVRHTGQTDLSSGSPSSGSPEATR
jgi:predicted nucleic acid-binding Zn ribbon protein